MKNLFILLMVAMVSVSSYAQNCCPYLGDIVTIPPYPTEVDTVKIVVNAITTSRGVKVYLNHNVSGNLINIEGCYFEGFLTSPQQYLDTLVIGTLAVGAYLINLKAYQSFDHSYCTKTDSNQRQLNFEVSSSVGLVEADLLKCHVSPNPTRSQFSVEGLRKARPIKVYDSSGRLVFEDREYQSGKIDCAHWRPGVYLILIENQTLKVLVSD